MLIVVVIVEVGVGVLVVLFVVGSSRCLGMQYSRHAKGVLELVVQDELHRDDDTYLDQARSQSAREPGGPQS